MSDFDKLVGTLGECAALGHDLDFACRCEHSRLVLMDEMAARLGAGFTVAEFARRYRCAACGDVGREWPFVSVRSTRAYPRQAPAPFKVVGGNGQAG